MKLRVECHFSGLFLIKKFNSLDLMYITYVHMSKACMPISRWIASTKLRALSTDAKRECMVPIDIWCLWIFHEISTAFYCYVRRIFSLQLIILFVHWDNFFSMQFFLCASRYMSFLEIYNLFRRGEKVKGVGMRVL